MQFDPLDAPGARNHELVLHARIDGHDRAHADEWLYGRDRRLIEVYNKALNILPTRELPYYRAAWARAELRHRGGILKDRKKVAKSILTRLRDQGSLATSAFADHNREVAWHWAPTREGRAVLEALFEVGEIGIARREGNRRYFDLIGRLVPANVLAERVSPEASLRHRLLSRQRAVGLMGGVGSAELVSGLATAKERARVIQELAAERVLVPLEIEGLARSRYVLADEMELLEATASHRSASGHPSEVSFLAPLDPLMWDRRLVRDLFGFTYIWEVYTPQARRLHGYYVLPILFGDRLVGRIEPRVDRASKTLEIAGVWFEPTFDPLKASHFPAALSRALQAYASFVGTTRLRWGRGRTARGLARVVNA